MTCLYTFFIGVSSSQPWGCFWWLFLIVSRAPKPTVVTGIGLSWKHSSAYWIAAGKCRHTAPDHVLAGTRASLDWVCSSVWRAHILISMRSSQMTAVRDSKCSEQSGQHEQCPREVKEDSRCTWGWAVHTGKQFLKHAQGLMEAFPGRGHTGVEKHRTKVTMTSQWLNCSK